MRQTETAVGLDGSEAEGHGGSLVELILAVADTSEDAFEIADRIDEAIRSGTARIDRLV